MKSTPTALLTLLLSASLQAQAPVPSALPDGRFKVDLLLVVAHPDDESEAGAFLAKAAFDEHKRLAVIFGTRGNSGGNAIGQEQAASLGMIREIEGRRALAFLGISNVWFLDAPDTPGQDVLRSLETWDHGRSLERVVRLVRLTRPDVIATWLPAYTAGENHGDHQAAGVLATEAFDIAGDATQFPEQVTPPRDTSDIGNLTEGLHPWQAQKLYYVSDASHFEFLKNRGPEYTGGDVSPSKGKSYSHLSAEQCSFHLTQSDSGYAARAALANNTVEKTYFSQPTRFVFGKAHVDVNPTAGVFEGLKSGPLPYIAAPGFRPAASAGSTVELGGPWHYYGQFWKAHGIDHLATLVPPEVEAGVSTRVSLPVLITNPGPVEMEGDLSVALPKGWTLRPGARRFRAGPGETRAVEVVAVAPQTVDGTWKEITIRAAHGDKPVGEVKVRARVVPGSLPQ